MFSKEEIDAVINEAQDAVSSLASDVGRFRTMDSASAATMTAAPVGPPSQARSAGPVAKAVPERLQRVLMLKVPVRVRLAERSMRLNEILKICPGTILEFERTVDSDLDLMVGNRQIGEGVAVRANEHFGLRVTRLRDVRARIESIMG